MIHCIRTVDAHAAGEPLRLVVEGLPSPEGRTMLEKRAWAAKRLDHFRRALMLEPRGHADMYGALITEAERPASDAGVLFMHNEGWSTMCGHGVIAVTTIAFERGLVWKASSPPALGIGETSTATLVLDVPAGAVTATATLVGRAGGLRVTEVAFVNVPSFVLAAGLRVTALGRTMTVDVAFGGAFYAIVDAEAAGLGIEAARLPELRRMGMAIKADVERQLKVQHPVEAGLSGIYGTIFTAPAREPEAHLRNVTIFADAEVDRSPCGSGTAAVMAVLDEMGLLGEDGPFVHESIVGTTFRGRLAGRARVGDLPAIIPEIAGSAWITGEHTFLIDGDDPLKAGFRI
jgi:proline racemase